MPYRNDAIQTAILAGNIRRRLTAAVCVAALTVAQAAPPTLAQQAPESGAPDAAFGAELADRTDTSVLLKNIANLIARVDDMEARLAEAQQKVSGAEMALATMAQTAMDPEALGRKTEELLNQAMGAIPGNLPPETKVLLEKAMGAIQTGDWVQGLPQSEIIGAIETARQAAADLDRRLDERRAAINAKLQSACAGVSASATTGLADLTDIGDGATWTAALAAAAASANLALPDCMKSGPDGAVDQDISEFIAEQQASQQMMTAMNAMMMPAIATGNPYVIAAALAFMAIMALFSSKGKGGGGDGKGSGKQTASGGQVGPGQQSAPDSDSTSRRTTTPSNPDSTYRNIKTGMGATVSVVKRENETLLRFRSTTPPETVWTPTWAKPARLNEKKQPIGGFLPPFSDAVRIDAVDFTNKRVTVTLPGEAINAQCKTPQTFTLYANKEGYLMISEGNLAVCL